MDGSGFDALTRALSGLRSRRGVAQVLLGAALGGAPARLTLDEAQAKRGQTHKRRKRRGQRRERGAGHRATVQADKKKGKKPKACAPCKKRKQGTCKGTLPDGTACPGGSCRAGSCIPTTPVCTPTCGGKDCGDNGCSGSCGDCTGGLTCQNGQCVLTCDSGLTACTGNCVDLETDAAHCGECGNECDAPSHATAICANSTCGFTCDAGFHQCGDECVSSDDPAHCGSACTPCPSSVCSPATCDGTTCGRAPIAGCCEDDGDCGDSNACTTDTCRADHTCLHTAICLATEVCVADGTRAHCCPPARPLWDGTQCAECTAGDVTRCAAPPHATAACDVHGTCSFTCEAGWGDCAPGAGCETNLKTDIANCGTCFHTCAGDERCYSGTCSPCLPATENLHAEIAAANPGDTVRLCAGTWELTRTIVIDKDLTLIGAGIDQTILDAGGNGSVLVFGYTAGITVTLHGLTIMGGKAEQGGGINNYTAQLMLIDVRVTGNSATVGGGGGIAHYSYTLTLVRSSVTENTGGHVGGGIINYSGTVILEAGSSVSGNSSPDLDESAGVGGGMYNLGGAVILEAGSSVSDNIAKFGAGIFNRTHTATAALTMHAGSTVSGNTATTGGGIYNQEGLVTLKSGSTVTNNTAEAGGGIYNEAWRGGVLTLEADNIVTGNHLTDGTTVSNCAPVNTIPNCIG